jgi:hypothetical protein
MTTEYEQLYNQAVATIEPTEGMIELVKLMKADGVSQLEIYCEFEARHTASMAKDKTYATEEEEATATAMERIWGWCEPEDHLFDHTLTKEEVRAYKEATQIAG